MIAVVAGENGLIELGQLFIRCRVNWKWYLFAFLPFGLYFWATDLSGNLRGFQFSGKILAIIALIETDWELISSLALLVFGVIIGVVLWRERNQEEIGGPNERN